jgi:hypothetical protein
VTPDQWLNGGTVSGSGYSYTAVGMQTLYNTVRTTVGANNLVIIGGQDYAYDLSQVVNGTAVTGYNIVYATHPYYEDGTLDQMPDWPTYFGNLSATAPVMATEFGAISATAATTVCDGAYDQSLITYFDAHKISWSAFAWWFTGGCTFPTLLSAWPSTPNAVGTVVMGALQSY